MFFYHTICKCQSSFFPTPFSLNFSFILFKYLALQPPFSLLLFPPLTTLRPHVTNCANIEFSVGYPEAAVGAAAALQGPAGGSTLNVSRNINKYEMLIFAQRWGAADGGRYRGVSQQHK